MTDENTAGPDTEGVDWTGAAGPDWQEATAAVAKEMPATYPEYSDNPHNHRFTISLAPDKPPFIVVRGQTATEITAAFNELEANGVYANLAAAWASLKAQGTIGAGLGPVSPVPPQGPPPGPMAGPVTYAPQPGAVAQAPPPPFGPNVSVPQAPGYQGPPQQQWQQAAPQSGGWNGGGGAPQGGNRDPKPRPAGWAVVDVPFDDKERFKGLRAQGTETGNYLRGKIQWGGKGVYWLEPSIAGWLAQQGFPVTQ
jgi:hypothetical protein